jgi:ABC-type Fe3+ transport system substrate-binding protein
MTQKRWLIELAYTDTQPDDRSSKWVLATDETYTSPETARTEAYSESYGCYVRVRRTDRTKGEIISWPDHWIDYTSLE